MKKLSLFIILASFILGCAPTNKARLVSPPPSSVEETAEGSSNSEPSKSTELELTPDEIINHPILAEFKNHGIEVAAGTYDSLLTIGVTRAKKMLAYLEKHKERFFALRELINRIEFSRKAPFMVSDDLKLMSLNPDLEESEFDDVMTGIHLVFGELAAELPDYGFNLKEASEPKKFRALAELILVLKEDLKKINLKSVEFLASHKTERLGNSSTVRINPDLPREEILAYIEFLALRKKMENYTPHLSPLGVNFDFGPGGDYEQAVRTFAVVAPELKEFAKTNPLIAVKVRSRLPQKLDVEYNPDLKEIYMSPDVGADDIRAGLKVFPIIAFLFSKNKQVSIDDSLVTVWNYERPLRVLASQMDLLLSRSATFRDIEITLGEGPAVLTDLAGTLRIPYGCKESQLKALLESLPGAD